MKTKLCTNCKLRKQLNIFSKNKNKKDGYKIWCKDCCKEYKEKNKQKIKIWAKQYRNKNKTYIAKHMKQYRIKNNIRFTKSHYRWLKKHPWMSSFGCAKQRCTNPRNIAYKYYGGRGIKFLMTTDDFKYLWFRDKAYNMKNPSIDRKDNDGHYILENCQIMELKENTSKQRKRRLLILR